MSGILFGAVAGLVVLLALRIVLPTRIWLDLRGALDYLVGVAGKAAVLILALVILAAFFQSMHG